MPVRFITEIVKGLFGASKSGDESAETETSITVEREADETESEDIEGDDETGEQVDEEPAPEAETDDETTADDVDDTADDDDDTADTEADDPVGEITGIGPTYSERLGETGIETVADLAAADPAGVAEAAQVSESRAADWITQAEEW